MKIKIILPVVIILVLLVSSYYFFSNMNKSTPYTYGIITRGNITSSILSTGTVQPVDTVAVGTQVTGKIAKLYSDFSDKVRKGQLLAVIDTTTLITNVEDARSALAKAQANYDQALVTEKKNQVLYQKNFISELNYDSIQTNVSSALADLETAQSALDLAIINLGYAYIYAPISGTIQNRAVEEGQTVAASLATPTLYTIAEDLNKMEIVASIDESDIGQIKVGQKVDFTVQAYPDKKFFGAVIQIRLNSQIVNNVVDYSVVINAENKDGFLLPGMTATIDFYIQKKDSVLLVPNTALKFIPPDNVLAEYNKADTSKKNQANGNRNNLNISGSKQNLKPKFGKIWYYDNNHKLRMTPVVLGITDGKMTEIVRGNDLTEGINIITGIADNQ
jgi:HlyD family secretion protein